MIVVSMHPLPVMSGIISSPFSSPKVYSPSEMMSIGPLAMMTVFNSLANSLTYNPLMSKLSLEIISLSATSTPFPAASLPSLFVTSRFINLAIALISDMFPLIAASL